MTQASNSPARIGFFVGGAAGIALIVPGLEACCCIWVPAGAVFTLFLASRSGAIDLAAGVKGGSVCGLLAALVVTLNLGLQVGRDPAEFARGIRRALDAQRSQMDPAEQKVMGDLISSMDASLSDMIDLGSRRPIAATVRWLGLGLVTGFFLVAEGVLAGLLGAVLFRTKAPP